MIGSKRLSIPKTTLIYITKVVAMKEWQYYFANNLSIVIMKAYSLTLRQWRVDDSMDYDNGAQLH